MYYTIFDSTGNLIDSFEDEQSARAAMDQIVNAEPEAAEHLALFICDDNGKPVGDPIFARAISSVH